MTTLDLADRRREARATQRWRHIADLDPVLAGAALILSLIGVALVWSASRAELLADGADTASAAKRQALSLAIGLVLAYGVSRAPHRSLRMSAPAAYVAGLFFLLITFTSLGSTVAGARAWLALPGGMTIQPSEFVKVGLILMLAVVASADDRTWLLRCLGVAGLPLAIVLLQNDTGTMLVMAAVAFTIVAIAGAPTRWIVGSLCLTALAVSVAVQLHLLQDYQLDRLTSFLHPDTNGLGAGYNTAQARIAVGGGGIVGQGLFHGSQTQGGFVPVNESDFIFTVVAEELGLIGAFVVIGLVAVILWRGLVIAAAADTLFARLVATGIVAWFGFQSFENIGMTLGITPVTGVTLPFVSAGGSSIMAAWIGVGILQVLHLRRRRGVLARPADQHFRRRAG